MWCNPLLENLVYLKYYRTLIIVRLTDFIPDTYYIAYQSVLPLYNVCVYLYHIDDVYSRVYYNTIIQYILFYLLFFFLIPIV